MIQDVVLRNKPDFVTIFFGANDAVIPEVKYLSDIKINLIRFYI